MHTRIGNEPTTLNMVFTIHKAQYMYTVHIRCWKCGFCLDTECHWMPLNATERRQILIYLENIFENTFDNTKGRTHAHKISWLLLCFGVFILSTLDLFTFESLSTLLALQNSNIFRIQARLFRLLVKCFGIDFPNVTIQSGIWYILYIRFDSIWKFCV